MTDVILVSDPVREDDEEDAPDGWTTAAHPHAHIPAAAVAARRLNRELITMYDFLSALSALISA